MEKKRIILGLVEPVVIFGKRNLEEKILARIDTGATASSIDFKIAQKLHLGPVLRSKTVKSASGIKRRPMIKAKIKLDGEILVAEFTLAERSHMTYPALVGQNILKLGHFLIDPQKEIPQKR